MLELMAAYVYQRNKMQSPPDEEPFYARYAHVPFSGVSSVIGRMIGRIAPLRVSVSASAAANSKASALDCINPEDPDQLCLQQISR